jgi:Ca2+-binding EF-hand superfamily protein
VSNIIIITSLGNIGIDELEEPLIALGLVSGREEVQKLIDEVDKNYTQQIEFNEFLLLMSNIKNKNDSKESLLYNFFTGEIWNDSFLISLRTPS